MIRDRRAYDQQLLMLIESLSRAKNGPPSSGSLAIERQKAITDISACRQNLAWGDTATALANLDSATQRLNQVLQTLTDSSVPALQEERTRLLQLHQSLERRLQSWPF